MCPKLAVILAAGEGRRLAPLTSVRPKCLIPVGGFSFLERTLQALAPFPFDVVCIVTGYRSELIVQFLNGYRSPLRIHTCRNSRFDQANNGYSLWLALREHAGLPFLLLDGDLLFEARLLERLLNDPRENLLVAETDRRLVNEESMKVAFASDSPASRVTALGKSIDLSRAGGEAIGMLKLSGEWSGILGERMEPEWRKESQQGLYYEDFLNRFLPDGPPLEALPTDGLRWAEVDTPEDLEAASRLWRPTKRAP